MTKLSIFDKIEEAKKTTALSQNNKIEHIWQNWRSQQNQRSSHKMTKFSIFDKFEKAKKKKKNIRVSQKMTKLSFFDKIEEAKKTTVLSQNDKIEHFWQKRRSEKIHGPLTKWQNWAFLTKLKKRKNTRVSQKMTKLSIFDQIEEAKKSTVLSQNDKIEHFWQNWRSEKIHEPLTKWQNGAFLTKIVWYITTHSVHIIYLCLSHNLKSTFQKWQNGPFLTKLKKWKKKIHFPLSENDKIEHFWQNWRSEKIHEPLSKWQNGAFLTKIICYITTHSVHIVYLCLSHNLKSTFQKWQNGPFLTKLKNRQIHSPLRKWQNWAFLTKLKKRKNIRFSQKMTKLSIFDKLEEAKKSTVLSQNDKIEHF